jgi:hypothetical protein
MKIHILSLKLSKVKSPERIEGIYKPGANSSRDPISKNSIQSRAGGVAQVITAPA